jgi:hypothetical protein
MHLDLGTVNVQIPKCIWGLSESPNAIGDHLMHLETGSVTNLNAFENYMYMGNQQNDPHMQNFPHGDDQMHLGIPECIRIGAKKIAYC